MEGSRVNKAVSRIEAALSRIEKAVATLPQNVGKDAHSHRYEAAVRDGLAELDAIIAKIER